MSDPFAPLTPSNPRTPVPLWKAIGVTVAAIVGVLTVVAAIGLGLNAAGTFDKHTVTPAAPAGPASRNVHISLSGHTSSANITLQVGLTGGPNSRTVGVPMTTEATGAEGISLTLDSGTWVYFTAQMQGAAGDLECVMTADGAPVAESSTAVDYGIVACNATV